jgi:hypothetical protein
VARRGRRRHRPQPPPRAAVTIGAVARHPGEGHASRARRHARARAPSRDLQRSTRSASRPRRVSPVARRATLRAAASRTNREGHASRARRHSRARAPTRSTIAARSRVLQESTPSAPQRQRVSPVARRATLRAAASRTNREGRASRARRHSRARAPSRSTIAARSRDLQRSTRSASRPRRVSPVARRATLRAAASHTNREGHASRARRHEPDRAPSRDLRRSTRSASQPRRVSPVARRATLRAAASHTNREGHASRARRHARAGAPTRSTIAARSRVPQESTPSAPQRQRVSPVARRATLRAAASHTNREGHASRARRHEPDRAPSRDLRRSTRSASQPRRVSPVARRATLRARPRTRTGRGTRRVPGDTNQTEHRAATYGDPRDRRRNLGAYRRSRDARPSGPGLAHEPGGARVACPATRTDPRTAERVVPGTARRGREGSRPSRPSLLPRARRLDHA